MIQTGDGTGLPQIASGALAPLSHKELGDLDRDLPLKHRVIRRENRPEATLTELHTDLKLPITWMEAQGVVGMRPATAGFVRKLDSDGISGRARLLQNSIFQTSQ